MFLQRNIQKKIIEAYEKNLFYLPLDKLGHFFERAYKITGDDKYLNILAYYFFLTKVPSLKKFLIKLKKKDYFLDQAKNSSKKIRAKLRKELYEKYPPVAFFDNLLVDLLFVKMVGLNKTILKNEYEEIVGLLKKIDFEQIYLKEEVLIQDNSFSFNSIFILNHLGVCDHTKKIVALFRSIYFDSETTLKKELLPHEYLSLIYSLTHIIISDSGFYEKFVKENFWILNYFAKNLNEILERTTLDILSEVGLCFKLCQQEKKYPKELTKIIKYLSKKAPSPKELANKEYALKKEHTNSILMLLLSPKFILFPGPDLSSHPIFN